METSKGIEFYFAIITGTLAFIIITGGFVIFFIRYQKRLLFQQAALHNKELKYKEDLLISNIQSVEEERRRIAKDIHDELGGIFSTLSLTVNQFKTSEAQNIQIISSSKELIDAGIKSVRRISHAIIPDELELFGLHNTLENYIGTINRSNGIDIQYINMIPAIEIKKDTELALYRIIQELISNTLKHAKASSILIQFEMNDNNILIKYQDNGIGNAAVSMEPRIGMGLKNIESRVIVLHGRATFNSSKGYTCQLQIPLPENQLV